MGIRKYLNLTLTVGSACFFVSCAQQPAIKSHPDAAAANRHRMEKVRTTAYTHTEKGALVGTLTTIVVAVALSSRFPVGTRFRIVDTKDEYIIDDYGTALVGTNTIDLYKTSRLEMRRWGVRHVDIDILRWGSEEESLRVLGPRMKHRSVRQMVTALEKKRGKTVAQVSSRTSL